MQENYHVKVLDENNEELNCDIVMFYFCDQNDIDYVFYTDRVKDENDDYNLYVSRFLGEEDGIVKIGDILSNDEWDYLDKVVDTAKDELLLMMRS